MITSDNKQCTEGVWTAGPGRGGGQGRLERGPRVSGPRLWTPSPTPCGAVDLNSIFCSSVELILRTTYLVRVIAPKLCFIPMVFRCVVKDFPSSVNSRYSTALVRQGVGVGVPDKHPPSLRPGALLIRSRRWSLLFSAWGWRRGESGCGASHQMYRSGSGCVEIRPRDLSYGWV